MSGLLRFIDDSLNAITMYRLLVYGLSIIAAVAVLFGFMGVLPYSGASLLLSLGVVMTVGYLTNLAFVSFFRSAFMPESGVITALILFCILPPVTTPARAVGVAAAVLLAIASKYLIARYRRHIFNPAAVAVLLTGLLGVAHAIWWIGSAVMLPFTVLLGLLILRKLRRSGLFLSFAGTALAVMLLVGLTQDRPFSEIIIQAFTSWPLVFLGTVMLTEPSTLPPRLRQQYVYGAVVGLVFASQVDIGVLAATPEVALLIGNLYAYAVGPKRQLRLRLREQVEVAPRLVDFVFEPDGKLDYLPGQYLAWTLPHAGFDNRSTRRTFTIASSPTEDTLRLGVRFAEPSSTFKRALRAMKPGDELVASQLAGDFTLPDDSSRKLLFIAGGIGVTPFRSMAKCLSDRGEQRDIVLLYGVADPAELAYQDVWRQAASHGLRLVPVLDTAQAPAGWGGATGRLDADTVKRLVPDIMTRRVYISGPPAMVRGCGKDLRRAGVRDLITDYFSGY